MLSADKRLSQRTVYVFNLIHAHSDVGITTKQLAEMLNDDFERIRNSVGTLCGQKKIKMGKRVKSSALWIPFNAPFLGKEIKNRDYKRCGKGPVLETPTNGPGYTQGKWSSGLLRDKPQAFDQSNKPHRNGTTEGNWVPPKWEPARQDANDNKRYGSRVGDKVVPSAPPKSCCAGVVSGPVGGGQMRRFA